MRRPAPAKLNLALVVGPRGPDGRHELTTVYQRIDMADRVAVEPSESLSIAGFEADTVVRDALVQLADAAGVVPPWRVSIEKRIPVAAGLGGGSSDAATALTLANRTLREPLDRPSLRALAREVGADVPFFLEPGPQLGERDGTSLRPVQLPQDYWVVVLLPHGKSKRSTASVYAAFDERDGASGYEDRRGRLLADLAGVRRARDLARLPPNDLASSPLSAELMGFGAFRSDVTGAGPAVYGLFQREADAGDAARAMESRGRVWLTVPAWYG